MNKNDNRFTEALASALHKMVERERISPSGRKL